MGARQYEGRFSREFAFQVEQHCRKCGKYVNTTLLRGSGSGQAYSPDEAQEAAVTSAMKQVHRQQKRLTSPYGLATYGVVCPACRHVIARARKRHFPRGFRAGLQWKAWKAFFPSLFWATPFVILAVLWVGALKHVLAEPERAKVLKQHADTYYFVYGGLFLFMGLAAYFCIRMLRAYWIVMRLAFTLNRFSESELHALVVEAHDANRESLHDRYWGRYHFVRHFWQRFAKASPRQPQEGEPAPTRRKRRRSRPGVG